MKLRNHLLLWFAVIGLLPLAVVLFFANQYYRGVYLAEIDHEMQAELRRLTAGLDQQFHHQRNLLMTLGRAQLLRRFVDELGRVIENGRVSREYHLARAQLKRFLLNLEPVVAEVAAIRILDHHGNTVVQVTYGGLSKPELESLLPYPLLEVEAGPAFSERLAGLPDGEVSYLRLPQRMPERRSDVRPALLDAVWPLMVGERRAYLVYSSSGERLDRLLAMMPRLRDARIGILENESGEAGSLRWLFSDEPPLAFSTRQPSAPGIPPVILHFAAAGDNRTVVDDARFRWFLAEYLPYPDRLLNWIVTLRVEQARLGSQYRTISFGLWALTAVVGLFAVLLAGLASRRLARPVTRLARNMRNYANGAPMSESVRSWSSEVNALESAFKQMIASLEKAREARSRAERQLVKSARLASIGEMAAGIGHELNNPLTNILSLAKLIERHGEKCPEAAEDARAIIEETQRAAHVVRGILNFARQIEPRFEPLVVREWLETSAKRMASALEKKRLDLRIDADASLRIDADRYQLEQVLINLLQNAVHASPPGAEIRVEATMTDGWLRVRVVDHGGGIDPAIEDRLFEPFVTSKPVGKGSGLGLSISLGIVEMHGGRLRLYNNDEGGCTAEIEIPKERE